MLPVLLSVLALAGAPPTTHVQCGYVPSPSAPFALGETFSTSPSGRPLNYVELGPLACGGLLYASASPAERQQIRRLNPAVDFDRLTGVGLQVALHEATHVALNSSNECLVEKAARAQIDGLLTQVADPGRLTEVEAAATASDAGLPANYKGC